MKVEQYSTAYGITIIEVIVDTPCQCIIIGEGADSVRELQSVWILLKMRELQKIGWSKKDAMADCLFRIGQIKWAIVTKKQE